MFAYSLDLSQTALCSVTCVSLFRGRSNPLDCIKTPNEVASVLDSVYTPTHPNIHQKYGCGVVEREGGSGAREGGQRAQEAYSGFVAWKDQPTAEQAAGTPQRRDVFSKINSRACKNRTMNVHLWLDMLLFLSSTSVASHPCSAVYNASTCRKSGVTSFPVVAAWLLCTINSGSAEPRACSLHMPCCVAAA